MNQNTKNKNKIIHVAGNNLLKDTGFSQQFFMEIVELKKQGFDISVLMFCHIKHFFKKNKIKKIRQKYKKKNIDIIVVPWFLVGKIFIEYCYFPIAYAVAAYLIFYKKIKIFHVHTMPCLRFFLPFKHFVSLLLLNDIHGVVIEEKIYNNQLNNNSFQHKYHNFFEEKIMKCCDINFCVSKKMIEYYIKKHKLEFNNFRLTRSTYDPEIFKDFDYSKKLSAKKKLGLKNKIVFLYMGHKKAWQLTEAVVNIFSDIQKHLPDSMIIFLSDDVEGITKSLQYYGIDKENYIITYVPHDEVPMYSYAADIAIILRDDSIVNRVASPVKFSEYIASGAMVIISNNIGDLPEIVKKYNIGYVIKKNNNEIASHIAQLFNKDNRSLAEKSRYVAEKEFSVENTIRVFTECYSKRV